jgi:hypothetical protein
MLIPSGRRRAGCRNESGAQFCTPGGRPIDLEPAQVNRTVQQRWRDVSTALAPSLIPRPTSGCAEFAATKCEPARRARPLLSV